MTQEQQQQQQQQSNIYVHPSSSKLPSKAPYTAAASQPSINSISSSSSHINSNQHSAAEFRRGEAKHFTSLLELSHYIDSGDVQMVDAVFCDPLGVWNHCTFSPSQCTLDDLRVGFPFDGSSIKLFTAVNQSDMIMKPDFNSCWIDPFSKFRTLHVVCSIEDTLGHPYLRCPRQIAKRAARVVADLGIADKCIFGPEPEFFVFDHVNYKIDSDEISVRVDGEEASWNSSRPMNNLGHRVQRKCMYFPVSPIDTMMDLRSEMLLTMESVGLQIEKHHHEAAICQHELGFRCSDLVTTADNLMTYKYIVKNVARLHGKSATFMPKPIYGDNGSGLHVHQSLWSNGRNLFFDPNGNFCKLSQTAIFYIGGILHHANAILAFTNPSTNSYKRLIPGYEAPCNLFYSKGNRSAAIRIPLSNEDNEGAKRLECRFPDPTANPYLAFSVLLLAGIDGIINQIEPPKPVERDGYSLADKNQLNVQSTPSCLTVALDALQKDHQFLLRDEVFSVDFIESYIKFKRMEINNVEIIPHPKEFELYYHL